MLPRTYRLSIYIVFFATLQLSIPIAAEIIPEQPNLTLHDPKDTLQPQVMGLSFNGTTSNKATETALRSPQVPLDVEHYTIAPLGLQLEQVHVYVRHGISYFLPAPHKVVISTSRRTHPCWSPHGYPTSINTRTLGDVQDSPSFSSCSIESNRRRDSRSFTDEKGGRARGRDSHGRRVVCSY